VDESGKERATTKRLLVVVAEEEQSLRTAGDQAHAVHNQLGCLVIMHDYGSVRKLQREQVYKVVPRRKIIST